MKHAYICDDFERRSGATGSFVRVRPDDLAAIPIKALSRAIGLDTTRSMT